MNEKDNKLYGLLDFNNIRTVQFGLNYNFQTWYGCSVYFNENSTQQLGYTYYNEIYDSNVHDKFIKEIVECDNDENKVSDNSSNPTKKIQQDNIKTSKNSEQKTTLNEKKQHWLDTLYVCDYCFKYTANRNELLHHMSVCYYKDRLPGKIKYLSPEYTIRRIRGFKHTLFCQCLCIFTKLFLDNKSMFFMVDNYEFFVVYETDGNRPLGFFSKDFLSPEKNNLACILIFPPYQRRGLGSLLIEFSYKISDYEGLISGPEKPLSPFGLIAYCKYWSKRICYEFIDNDFQENATTTLEDISRHTRLKTEDITLALEYMGCLRYSDDEQNGKRTYEIVTKNLMSSIKTHNLKHKRVYVLDEYLLLDI
ncbi:related to Histone acetyltransferase SAS2 [Saccharomycodes ludwigii]|uniref:histone acetyltransferase n=1 Tax=Saccharomycodes ludwigii TaxID=36035 RepID=A0A376B3E4_9ASCO|nr:hypothetical protein SCDLUD_002421 [Saccharomycodes ludwigii]KAH3900959.1 hypothetical protein SCDLUD_002421 [Saccharomycodes ludwigii]SSD58994.1 related to Histone acetyltransferase SAS2 [Saccharomycodes ludwigii]